MTPLRGQIRALCCHCWAGRLRYRAPSRPHGKANSRALKFRRPGHRNRKSPPAVTTRNPATCPTTGTAARFVISRGHPTATQGCLALLALVHKRDALLRSSIWCARRHRGGRFISWAAAAGGRSSCQKPKRKLCLNVPRSPRDHFVDNLNNTFIPLS